MSGLQTVCVSCGQSGRVQPVVLPVAESGKQYHDEIHACISAVEQTCGGPGRGQEEVCPPGWEGLPKWKCLVCVCSVVWVGATGRVYEWSMKSHKFIEALSGFQPPTNYMYC